MINPFSTPSLLTPIARPRLSDSRPRLGVISAFGAEADLLIEQTQGRVSWSINGNRFVTGRLAGNDVVIVLCGVGMVNAAMVSQCMLAHFDIRVLIMSGIAGGVDPKGHVGDVMVPERWTAPMEVYWSADENIPSPCGKPGDLAPLGLRLARDSEGRPYDDYRIDTPSGAVATGLFLRDTWVNHPDAPAGGEFRFDFPVDARLLAIARGLTPELKRTGPRDPSRTVSKQPSLHVGGMGASCSAFLANPTYRSYLQRTLGVRVIDMETAAVAQVAYANAMPFIGFRSLSDIAGGDYSSDVGAFFGSGLAELNASSVTLAFLSALSSQTVLEHY